MSLCKQSCYRIDGDYILILIRRTIGTGCRVKSGNFGHQVNSDIHLQTGKTLMRRLLMSRLIRIFTVCKNILFFITIIKI